MGGQEQKWKDQSGNDWCCLGRRYGAPAKVEEVVIEKVHELSYILVTRTDSTC